jgi:diguanylate cyclase (GGDEF)-like protein
MGLLLATYAAGLVLHGVALGPVAHHWVILVVDNWLGLAVEWVPAAVCWVAFSRVGARRPELLLAALAVTSYALGDTYWTAMAAVDTSVPFPSLGDVAYLGFTVLMMAALAVAVRREVRGFAGSVWLDSAVGSLGAATVLAVVLRPVLDSADKGPLSLATAVAVGYPMLDLALVATVAGIAALRDVRMGERWFLLIVGLLVYAAADVVYALQVTRNAYAVGSLLDLAWPVGLAMVALWVDGTAQPDRPAKKVETRPVSRAMALVVSAMATAAGLGVLLMSSRVSLSILAVALAGVTLLAAGARSQLAFRLVARMADLRRLDASTDELTGLPNRRALYAEGYARLAEPPCQRQALLMLDLDKFKEVNDNLGHHAGDQLLFQVGARLRDSLREGDLLARLGGDEFAMVLDDAGHDEAVKVAIKLRSALGEPFALQDMTLYSHASIGIALFPDDTDDGPSLSALLRKADVAMYRAKVAGDGHHVYSATDDAEDATRLRTVDELRTAMTSDQLVLYYQPKIDLDTGDVHSVEALVRWDHPTRNLLYPDAFLNVVEESGLMPTLTRVVLEMALDQAAQWQEQRRSLTIAVNLSASSLVDSGLPQEVFAMLAARGVPPRALQLEITEEFLMADRDRARNILTRLRDGGVQISVDDFGTGYSSLSYLRELPIDELKLDQSFIFPMADDARAAALVASTIALAHSLGLRMVAEGVETDVTYTELKRMGCDQVQGYFICRPVPAVALEHWLSNRPPVAQSANADDPLPLVAFGREPLE